MAGPGGAPVSLITTGIDLTDRAPHREDDERALEGDPQAKLAEVGRLATEQRALRRVATLVASEVNPERVFTAVSEECARVLQVNASIVLRYEGDGTATIVGRHNRDNIDEFHVGERLPAVEHSAFARVLATGAPARIDDWGRPHGRGRRGDLPHRLPLDRRRPDHRRRHAVGRGGDREREPAAVREREPSRRRSASSRRWPSPAPRRAPT